jgi:predicted nucleic acid-binding protein
VTQRYLLDTNVVSELRKPRPHAEVLAWLESLDDAQLCISAVTGGEIQAGIELTRKQDPDKAQQIEDWLGLVAGAYNVLPMDAAAFTAWAKLMHRKSDTLYEDAMIAATAKVHGLTVATRNTADFQLLGLRCLIRFPRFSQSLQTGLRLAHHPPTGEQISTRVPSGQRT